MVFEKKECPGRVGYRMIDYTTSSHGLLLFLSSPLLSPHSIPFSLHLPLYIIHKTPIFFHGRRRAVSTLDISPFVPRVRHSRLSPTSKGEATPEAQAQLTRSRSLAP